MPNVIFRRKPPFPDALPQNAKLCVMRLSAIGDVCHAVAMVQALQSQRPDVDITWVIGKIEYQLLQGLPGINFVVFDKKQGKQGREALRQTLSGEMFDVLFVMQVALRANWVSRVIKAKLRLGFDDHRSKELHSWFTNAQIPYQQHAHVLEGFMGFAQAVGVALPEKPDWQMPLSSEDTKFAQTAISGSSKVAVICPAASKPERCWLPERYAAVADHLSAKGYRVLLCGSPAPLDKRLAAEIKQCVNEPVDDFVGKTSLKQLLALLANADVVIAPDTGPAHMATTVGTPVIGLYAHSNPRRTGPYLDQHHVVSVYEDLVVEQTGKPWESHRWGKRVKGADLMSRITVQAVLEQLDKVLTND